MKTKFLNIFIITILISNVLINLNSCSERDGTVSCFPNELINAELFINGYNNLNTLGWEYTKGETGTGTRGLIIYKSGNGFKIYDRNAPHVCPSTNTTLEVIKDTDGFYKIYCPKDGAKWLLQTGEPNNTLAKGIPRSYQYNYNITTGILYIYY